MAAYETLREYLVSVGFRVDDASFRKFNSAVVDSAKPVLKLGAAVAATAGAIEVMVEKIGHQMEDLYYSAQRANVLVGSLQAVSFAARQVGLSAGSGAELMEALGRSMRSSPGIATVVQSLGGELQVVNGQLGVTDDGLRHLLQTLAGMPRYQALSYASVLGLDPEALNQILNNLPAFIAGMDKSAQLVKDAGLNSHEAAKDFAEFGRHVGVLEERFSTLGQRVAHDWLPYVQSGVDWMDRLVKKFEDFNNASSGKAGLVGSGVAAGGGISAILGALSLIPGLGWLAGIAAVGGGATVLGAGAVGTGLAVQNMNRGLDEGTFWDPEGGMVIMPGGSSAPLGIRNNNPGNLMPGGKEASFPTALAGLQAMAAQLRRYGARGIDTLAGIISTWAPAAAGNNVHSYIGDVLGRTGFYPGAHLDMSDPSVIQSLMNGMIMHEQGMNPYGDLVGQAARSVTLSQKTTINISGAGDPAAVGRRAADEQQRVTGDAVRNLGGVLR